MLIVQCDFDDTITVGNVSVALRETFGPENWEEMEQDYLAGQVSVEESNIRQYGMITASQKDIEDFVLGSVVIRYAFDEFVDYCRGEGLGLAIVSSGLDIYIRPALETLSLGDLDVHSGRAQVTPDGISVEYRDPLGAPLTGEFKDSYVRHFQDQGHTVVYVGDGLSDEGPAALADFVIARSSLESHLKEQGLPHYSFETFEDVGRHVEHIRGRLTG